MNDDRDRAFGRDGYVREGLADALHGFGKVLGVLLIILAMFIAYHVVPAWLSQDSPPAACSIAGGTWNLWNGWTCG